MSAATLGVNIENNFWVWNPWGGTKGIFESNPFTVLGTPVPYYLPAYSGVFVRTTANTGNTVTFTEAAKVSNTPSSLFKTTAAPTYLELRVEDSANVFWDKFILVMDSSSTDARDKKDAKKFFNSEMNFYSFSSQKDSLAIDSRPYTDGGVVKIDMWTALKRNFILNVSKLGMLPGTSVILRDNYKGIDTVLSMGTKYPFTINTDSLSFSKRFELRFAGNPIDTTDTTDTVVIIDGPKNKKLKIHVYPNPATTVVNVDIDAPTSTPVIVNVYKINLNGVQVYSKSEGMIKNATVQIPVASLPNGPYIVEVVTSTDRKSKHFVKQ
jgi:hypothetical protein